MPRVQQATGPFYPTEAPLAPDNAGSVLEGLSSQNGRWVKHLLANGSNWWGRAIAAALLVLLFSRRLAHTEPRPWSSVRGEHASSFFLFLFFSNEGGHYIILSVFVQTCFTDWGG